MKAQFSATTFQLLVSAVVMEALLLVLRYQGDLRYRIPETIGILLLTSIFYTFSVFLVLKPATDGKSRAVNGVTLLVAGAAIGFRLTVWPLFPQLSDDPFRYRWEGMLQAHGGNPYQSRPIDPEWSHLRDSAFPRVVAKDVKGGYGPLLELIERWTYRGVARFTDDPHAQVFWFKLPYVMFDLGLIAVLWALLAAKGLATERLLIYAWSPLPVVEFWATGHNDSVAIFFVVLALLAAARQRWTPAFAALTLAACAKIWPLVLFPIFVGWKRFRPRRWYQWLVSLPIAGLLGWPYWSNVEENVRFMSGFLGGWRNNDSLYGLLLWLTGDQYPAKYAAFAIVGGTALVVTLLRWPLERAVLSTVVVMLFVSANCHPWYLTWIIPLLAIVPVPALLLWTALIPLAYRVVIEWAGLGQWHGSTAWRWHIYVPVYGMLLGTLLVRLARRKSAPEHPL